MNMMNANTTNVTASSTPSDAGNNANKPWENPKNYTNDASINSSMSDIASLINKSNSGDAQAAADEAWSDAKAYINSIVSSSSGSDSGGGHVG